MDKWGVNRITRPVTFVVVLYIIFGGAWILFSDMILLGLLKSPESLTRIQTFKGWFYVFASGGLIYFLMTWILDDLRKKEKILQDTERLHEDFLNKHYQPLWKSDAMGNCLFNNEKWVELTGRRIEPNKPFAWLDGIHSNDKAACIDAFTYGFISKKEFELEYRLQVKNNEYHWVQNNCIPYFNSAGRIEGFYGFYTHIQEKKNLQENYKDSSRKYGYLFSSNPNPMLVYDTSDYRILEVNQSAIALYGYSEKEFLSMTLMDLRPPNEVPFFMDHVSESLPEFHRSSGWLHRKKDGDLFDAEISAHSLPVSNGRRQRLVLIRDITSQKKAFRTAKEGQQRFMAIFENSPQGAIICNADLTIADINPSACRILETSQKEAESLSLKNFIHYEFDKKVSGYLEKINAGIPVAGEINMTRNTGNAFMASFNALRFTESGNARIFFAFSDIDDTHKMQIALQQSERINATLVSNLPGMVYRSLYDEAWTMTYVSFGVEKLTGYKPEEILFNSTISYEQIIHPDDRMMVRDQIRKANEKRQKLDLQYRILTRDKTLKWVWEQAQNIFNAQGEMMYMEGFIIDITHEHEARQEVKFQSMFLELVIDNIPFPLFYTDVNARYTGCNKAFCEFTQLEKDNIIGHSVDEIFDEKQADEFMQNDRELLRKGGTAHAETEIHLSNGAAMNAVIHKTVFYDLNENPLGIIGLFFDITQRVQAENVIRKQLDELERINSELEKFSYTVSHDLRSPLVTIKGFLGLLKEDIAEQNNEQIQEDISRISNATDKMQQLLEDLLKLSRMDKKVELNQAFSMTQVATEAHELLYGLLKDKNCTIEIDPEMPVVIAGKSRLRELYQNLLENAVKFSMPKGDPVIKIYSRKQDNMDVFCVRDNGIGIPEKYHNKVFGLFTKLDSSSSGTGIGLALVKRIVDHYNGRIWIESSDEGTTICFTIHSEKLVESIS